MEDSNENINVDIVEEHLVLDTDKEKGIHQPGIMKGTTYVDCNGNTRHKYETLHAYTSNTISELKEGNVDEKSKEKNVENETSAQVSDSDKEPSAPEAPTDIVNQEAKDEVVVNPVIKEKPAPVSKPAAKTTAPKKRTPAKKKPAAKTPTKTTSTKK